MKKKKIITLLTILVPVVITLLTLTTCNNSSITTEKDTSYKKKVGRIFVVAKVEERLKPVFAHSFEHSMISAFQSNGVDAIVTFTSHELDSLKDYAKEAETFAPDATMRININPLYLTLDDGYKAIIGTDFEVSLIDTATEKSVWHAIGKVDYIAKLFIKKKWRHYRAHEGIRKEFAWNTTALIVRAFISEVNGQKPAPIYTVTEERQRHGQRIE